MQTGTDSDENTCDDADDRIPIDKPMSAIRRNRSDPSAIPGDLQPGAT